MRDRIPETGLEGKVSLEFIGIDPDNGNVSYYKFTMADNAIPGTELNKFNLLQDETAMRLGLNVEDDPTVNDAFMRLAEIYGGGGAYLGASYLGATFL
jgi:hypothetical protein